MYKIFLSSPQKRRRFFFLGVMAALIGGGITLVLTAFRDNLVYFYTPSDLTTTPISPVKIVRLGGRVAAGTVHFGSNNQSVSFAIEDEKSRIMVSFSGILPDLFREGQGIVVEGVLTKPRHFSAQIVLAKHDETYRPPDGNRPSFLAPTPKSSQKTGDGQ